MLCPCRKKSKKPESPQMIMKLFKTGKLLKGQAVQLMVGSRFFQTMQAADMAPLLPTGMGYYELAGTPSYPSTTDLLDVVPPTSGTTPVVNPPLGTTGLTYAWPSQIWGKKASLIILGKCDHQPAGWGDVNEGSLGDCWLMAAIAATARYGVAANVFTAVNGPDPTNPDSVELTLYEPNGPFNSFATPFNITVTTEIPVTAQNKLYYVTSETPGEYWPCIIEKAAAAVIYKNGSNGYNSLAGGYVSQGMGLLFPGYSFLVGLNTDAYGNVTSSVTDVYNAWKKLMKAGNTIDVSFNPIGNTVLLNGQLPGNENLLAKHAYTLYALVEAPLGTATPISTTPTVRLALLRNPYGTGTTCKTPNGGEWSGTWSDCDTNSWNANPWVTAACNWDGLRNDGMFWMAIDDIVANMSPFYGLYMPTDPAMKAVDLTANPLGGTAATIANSQTCEPVTVTVNTKKHPEELAWSIPGTSMYAPAGLYTTKNTTYNTSGCIEPGNYEFVATDTWGAGWNGGTYAITVNNTLTVPPTTVANGNSQSTAFTVS